MKQLVRFLLVGGLNTVLGYAVIFGCMYLGGLSPETSNVLGYGVGLTTSYALNRTFTFGSRQRVGREATKFFVVFLGAYALNFVVLLLLVRGAELHAGASQLLAGIVYLAAFYLLSRQFVFAPR
jgi:putative flippase GtrA